MSLRPSSLPKLAVCACYESNPDAGSAANRGTALDSLFRSKFNGEIKPVEFDFTPGDTGAVEWAVTTIKALAGGNAVETDEERCKVWISGFENPGTADAIISFKLAHADLKTGQKRNYREQMAAYALGLMDRHFAAEWTAHLLFCDQKEVETLRFTFDEAERIVRDVIERFNDPDKRPEPCEYCSWCAKQENCPARLALAAQAVEAAAPGFDFEAVLADNGKLGKFLVACSVIEDLQERAKATARERLAAGVAIPGWRLVRGRSSEFVDHVDVGRYIDRLGFGEVFAAYGNMSARKFREIWELKMGSTPFPEELIKHAPPSAGSLRREAVKPTKTKTGKD